MVVEQVPYSITMCQQPLQGARARQINEHKSEREVEIN